MAKRANVCREQKEQKCHPLTDHQLHSNLENNLLNPWRDNDALKLRQTFKTNN